MQYTLGTSGTPDMAAIERAISELDPSALLDFDARASIEHGYWYSRSAEFMQQPLIEMLVWMRMPGDTIFSIGAVALAWFVLRLWIAPKREAIVDGQAESAGR